MKDILRGTLVRLAADPPEALAKGFALWGRDSEYARLADSDPATLWSEKKHKERIEKSLAEDGVQSWHFSVHILADDKLIGEVGIRAKWVESEGWVGIAIGDREYWSRGFGTDAMRLIMQFGFYELGLYRLSLSLHSYNIRARRVYEKLGFTYEGTMRGDTFREGRHTDGIYMGLLRREWLALEGGAQ
jgi:RimJ/RimL family protein N-acetyltransferase